MEKKEILKEWLQFVDQTNLKEGHYNCILEAMEEYAKQQVDNHVVLANVSETAEGCLKQIADPINHMRKQAEADGCVLDGMMAVRLSEDPHYLKQLAVDWLKTNSR